MLVVVDIGVGNLGSIRNMLRKIQAPAVVAKDAQAIESATKIILPGVGAFDGVIDRVRDCGLEPVLNRKVLEERVPYLGVCVGAQILGHGSEEGKSAGLGWLDMNVRRFDKAPGVRIPHMGWNAVTARPDCPLFNGQEGEQRFYFAHSYQMCCNDDADIAAQAEHGRPFTAAVARDNIFGVQFHPEKSHRFGIALFRNFVEGIT